MLSHICSFAQRKDFEIYFFGTSGQGWRHEINSTGFSKVDVLNVAILVGYVTHFLLIRVRDGHVFPSKASDRKGEYVASSSAARPKISANSNNEMEVSNSSGPDRVLEVSALKEISSGPVQLLKKNSGPVPISRSSHQDPSAASDSDGRRLWERDDKVIAGKSVSNAGTVRARMGDDDGFMGPRGSSLLGADAAASAAPEADAVGNRKEAASFRVISQAVGPHSDQVLRSVEATGESRPVGHATQATAVANAQFVGQLAHPQHGIDVHQLPSEPQFLHQHLNPEGCLQQPIFLVKLPQQQQMAQGGSQPPV